MKKLNQMVSVVAVLTAIFLAMGCGIEDDPSGSISDPPECVCDADCPTGQICEDGECVDETAPPECTTDEDCAEGQACEDGECVDLPDCVLDTDCAEGEACEDGICTPVEPDPDCTEDADCAEGEICVDGECAEDTEVDPVEEFPAPFRSPECSAVTFKASLVPVKCDCIMDFNSFYTSGSTCGEVRGEMTNMTWESGPEIYDSTGDGYMGMSYEIDAGGTYRFSYLGYQDCDGKLPREAWAQYGHAEFLERMTADARSYIECNWWDSTTQTFIEVESPSCSLKIEVALDCTLTGAGNMANFGE